MSQPTRRTAREIAFQVLYHRAKLGITPYGEDLLIQSIENNKKLHAYCKYLIQQTWDNLDQIDSVIEKYLINWKQSRISDSLNALLRLSVCELLFEHDIEGKIILNEAIEICKKYVDEKATKMCNGVLHSVYQKLNP